MNPAEIAKYEAIYDRMPNYRMGEIRMRDALKDLAGLMRPGSLLDVGCGRGEIVNHAERLGFDPAMGLEAVPGLCDGVRIIRGCATELPWAADAFDYVTMFDVIEHLPPPEDARAVAELCRVARRAVVLTANNKPSHDPQTGADLHINKRDYQEWHELLTGWAEAQGFECVWLKGQREYVSETWHLVRV